MEIGSKAGGKGKDSKLSRYGGNKANEADKKDIDVFGGVPDKNNAGDAMLANGKHGKVVPILGSYKIGIDLENDDFSSPYQAS